MPDFLPGIYFTFLNLSGFELTDKVKSSIEYFLKCCSSIFTLRCNTSNRNQYTPFSAQSNYLFD